MAIIAAVSLVERQQDNVFVVMPHHLLTQKKINEFYELLQTQYKSFDNIVIISPNHFYRQESEFSTLEKDQNICFKDTCIKGYTLFTTEQNIKLQGDKTNEHGIGEHIILTQKYFPQSKIYPILTRRNIIKGEESDFWDQAKTTLQGRTLFIASVDFSHHVDEDFAIYHDFKSIDALKRGDFTNIEVDCPNCLKTIYEGAHVDGYTNFDVFARTSVDSITKARNKTNNTSHILGAFTKDTNKDSTISLAFFGDANMLGLLNQKNKSFFEKYLKTFYQAEDREKDLQKFYHKKLFGFDFVSVNLETKVLEDKKICEKYKTQLNFDIQEDRLDLLKNIGVNIVNIANNHQQDCGNIGYQETLRMIEKNNLNMYGNVFDDINIFTGEIRGQKIAFLGFNNINGKLSNDKKLEYISELKNEGYIVLVNIHRGEEYKLKANDMQRQFGHQMIDAGADLIIGHHPHVIQDMETYKGKQIFYSLGNFLFLQGLESTQKGMGVLVKITNGMIETTPIYFKQSKTEITFL